MRVRDDLLTPTELVSVADAFKGLSPVPWWSARARFSEGLTEAVLARAFDGGLRELWLGLESGSERLRRAMNKGVSDRDIHRILDAAERVGVGVRLLCIVGFPGETDADADATRKLLRRAAPRITGVSVTPFQLLKRSPMEADLPKWGLTPAFAATPPRELLRAHIPLTDEARRHRGASARIERIAEELADFFEALPSPDPLTAWQHRVLASEGT